ncbi:hypothetical protein [Saccharopolyspora shandongensis]|uniref:hypothetical protein n=1 Tax=Saccharopolyspora shandongensis TaxID=418495 RepID=UPI0033E1D612
MTGEQPADLRETVREHYAVAATAAAQGSIADECCCDPQPVKIDDIFGASLYSASERDQLPVEAIAVSRLR